MKQICHAGFARIKDIRIFGLAQPLSLHLIDKLGHTYLHMLVVCSGDLKIPGAHSHDLGCPSSLQSQLGDLPTASEKYCRLSFHVRCKSLTLCVCAFFNLDVVALLPPLHVPSLSLPSQYSWTGGSQNQDLVNSFIPPTQVLN